MTRLALRFLALPFVSLAALAGSAHADLGDECAVDADCGKGLTCQVVGGTSCACPDGAACEPCETTEFRACVPGPCAADADCGEGLVCVSYEVPCAGAVPMPDCAEGQSCDPMPTPEPCEATTASVCAPRWVLPCEADADCGEGFACEFGETCSCSGGGATDPAVPPDGGSGSGSSGSGGGEGEPVPPPEDDCTCEPTEEKLCQPKELTCNSDADCPSGWSCAQMATDVACAAPADGSTPDCPPPAEPGPGSCYPTGYWGVADDTAGGGDGNATPSVDLGLPRAESASPVEPKAGTETEPSAGCNGGAASALPLLGMLLALALRRRVRADR